MRIRKQLKRFMNMKVIYSVLFALIALICTNAQAQIFKVGMGSLGVYSQAFSMNKDVKVSLAGLNTTFHHSKFATILGVLMNNEGDLVKLTLSSDYHLKNWHHAYLARRVVPFVGLQLERSNMGEIDNPSYKIYPKAGVKGSFDRFTWNFAYLNNFRSDFLQMGITYVLWIGSNCSMKRVKEINKQNWSDF
ncbi:MAG: hypothetical protein ACON5K_11235 [Bacteroidia bacterium]